MASAEIELTVDEKQAVQALTKVIGKLKETGDTAEESLGRSTKAFEVFQGVFTAEIAVKALEKLGEAAAELFKIFLVDGVKAAAEQEKSLTRLQTALKLAGNATATSKDDFAEFAQQLQEMTGIQDEASLSSIALLQSLGPLTERGLKEGTKAAADLAAALGVDLDTAIRAVGAASNGNLTQLQRLTKQTFTEGTNDVETFSLAIEQLNKQFGGSAAANFATFDGGVKGLQNSFEDMIKTFGKIIIENDALKAAFGEVSAAFNEFGKFIEANKKEINDFVTGGVTLLVDAFKTVVGFIKQFAADFNTTGTVLNTIKEVIVLVGTYLGATFKVVLTEVNVVIGLFKQGLLSLGISFDTIIGTIKLFVGLALNGLVTSLSTVLGFLGGVVSLVNKDLGNSLKNALTPIKDLGLAFAKEGQDQLDGTLAIQQAKQAEVDAYVEGENKKQAKQAETGALTKAKAEEDKNIFLLLAQARQEAEINNNQILTDIRTAQDAAEFQRLSDNLGREEALRQLSAARKLAAEGKDAEARKAIRETDRKAAEKDLGSLFDFEKNTNAGRAANFKSTLGTIATLQSSNNETLFAIGKAAAIATATIDGIAATQKALASAPPPFNFILAGIVGVASAVNIAKIASAQPPGRQEGGLVPGLFNPTDNTLINAAPGELVLNRRQQTSLFNAINQDQVGGGGGGTSVIIQGNVIADDDSQVQKLITRINDNINFRNARLA